MTTGRRSQSITWLPLDPCCLECQIIAAWRERHPEAIVVRPEMVAVGRARLLSAHPHRPVVRSRADSGSLTAGAR